ncbi:MAG: Ig-like domain-containing protein, partial [Tannerellaceae bacterium]|nr:Ig-like domain-containing protein [Tannerellaceae bacterium]
MRRILGVGMVISLLLLVHACANMATPNGGPYDEDPPKFISSTPAPNEAHFTGKKIEILFDELIQIDSPNENVIITPPQLQLPVIRAVGKKVVVELKDTLMDNTTYTIDFTNSIADNNEKNVLENFSFAFATGEVIDSLEISGILLNAENLEPMPSITIGLHQNLEDSAFVKNLFVRTSRTNERGQFTIRNIAPGTYRIYALNDLNRDYKFDQPGEDIAFGDSLIVPTFEFTSRNDTIWQDSLTVDTVYTIEYTRFMPNDILLRLFKEKFQRQYMLRPERTQSNRFTLRFNADLESIPDPVPLNFTPPDSVWYFSQLTEEGKSVHYWIMDSTVWKQDTLQLEVNYLKSDSLNILRPQTDTVQAVMRQRPVNNRRKKKEVEEPLILLRMNIDASGTKEMTDTISIVFDEPVPDLTSDPFYLNIREDTLWVPVEFEFFRNEADPMTFHILRKWKYGEAYKLEVDSATIFSLYGKWNDAYDSEFKIRNEDEYGHLYINITGVEPPAFVELLNSS